MGLSIAYGVIDRHGGTIEVDSQVGVGTTFTIHLPVDKTINEGYRTRQTHPPGSFGEGF
jgi:signal transduction histidine kinase